MSDQLSFGLCLTTLGFNAIIGTMEGATLFEMVRECGSLAIVGGCMYYLLWRVDGTLRELVEKTGEMRREIEIIHGLEPHEDDEEKKK